MFEKVSKPEMDNSSLERLTEVENEIATVKTNQATIQSTLNEILNELRRSNNRYMDSPLDTRPSISNGPPMANGQSDRSSSTSSTSAPGIEHMPWPGL